jgi:Histidine kinase-, DNA gyrase B-, and HSP90-like ATPase
MTDSLLVRSHVGRDILQSAGVFKNERLAVWEYVSNGLEYVDPGTKPEVRVLIKDQERKILIGDNGRGMAWSDLQTFFLMHGENADRRKGHPGRGFFGTGKSAAFGIADTLRITTVKKGKRSKVELTRAAIESMECGEPIPVRAIEKEVHTDQNNGTLIEIEGVHLRRIDQSSIVQYIERHVSRWPGATVFVNRHQCEYREPPLDREFAFRPETPELRDSLGDIELKVRVSKVKLDEESRGVAIFSRGVWHETTLAGAAGRDMSEYIFGELEVARLTEDRSPISAFDMSRSMQLNRSNELVQSIFGFVGACVERVRRALVEEERRRRQTQEARKLNREAEAIARIINQDFEHVRARIGKVRSRQRGGRDLLDELTEAADRESIYALGGDEPVVEMLDLGSPPKPPRPPGPEPSPRQLFERTEESSDNLGQPTDETRRRAQRMKGGFSVDFRSIGVAEPRVKYERDERTIYINLDHPQIKTAIGVGRIESIEFRRLSYEVAFTEYAIALAREMVLAGEYYDMEEPVMELRDTIDRVSRAAAHLYGT